MTRRGASAERTVAVFDLDGTLTAVDTSLPFLRQVAGKARARMGVLGAAAWAVPDLAASWAAERVGGGLRLGGIRGRWEGAFHQRVAAFTLRGRTRVELEAAGAAFAGTVVEGLLRPDARGRIEPHRAQGHFLLMASASLDAYVEPLAALLGFDAAVGTRLEYRNEVATGRFLGLTCWGAEKLRRVREVLGVDGPAIHHAYGDSAGDRALLEAALDAVWVR